MNKDEGTNKAVDYTNEKNTVSENNDVSNQSNVIQIENDIVKIKITPDNYEINRL